MYTPVMFQLYILQLRKRSGESIGKRLTCHWFPAFDGRAYLTDVILTLLADTSGKKVTAQQKDDTSLLNDNSQQQIYQQAISLHTNANMNPKLVPTGRTS